MTDELEEMIRRLEQARTVLDAAIEKVTPQLEIYPTWKIKQLLDHITGWDVLIVSTLHAYAEGNPPPIMVKESLAHYNAKSIAARSEQPLEQSRQDYDDWRKQVLETLRGMPEEASKKKFPAPWGGTCTLKSVVKIFASHELEHARHIEQALSGDLES